MWVQAIREAVLALISLRIGHGGAAQQADAHHTPARRVIADIMTILAIVEQAYAVIAFAQVYPFVSTGFKAGPIPTGVAMGGPLNVAPLDVVGGDVGQDIHRESHFEQNMAFVPVNRRIEIQARAVVLQGDALHVVAMQNAAAHLQCSPQRAGLDHVNRDSRIALPHLVLEKDIDIPRIPPQGSILKGLELIGYRVRWQDVPLANLVINTCDVT